MIYGENFDGLGSFVLFWEKTSTLFIYFLYLGSERGGNVGAVAYCSGMTKLVQELDHYFDRVFHQ